MSKEKKPLTKKAKIIKIIGNIFTGVFVAFILFGTFVLISSKVSATKSKREGAPTKIGNSYLPIVVITDSMEPEYKVNTAIFVKDIPCEQIKEDFDKGYTCDLTFYDGYSLQTRELLTQETKDFLESRNKYYPTTNLKTTMTHRLMYIQENENVEYGNGRYFFFVEGINRNNLTTGAENQYQIFTENEIYGVCKGHNDFVGGFYIFVSSSWGLIILLLVPSLYMIISSILDLVKDNDPDEGNKESNPLAGLSKADQKKLKEQLLNEMLNGGGK